jgi:GMP synthase-like glutamine amidotransferase
VLVVEHEADAGLGRMAPPLAATTDLDIRRPYLGDDLPADTGGLSGLIVLGGEMGALDDDAAPWLITTRKLLAAAVETGLPTLGICLGAQLLAAACGGRVERGGSGLEVGVVEVSAEPPAHNDPLLGPVFGGWHARPVAQYHRDEITELPPGAVRLATGAAYPNQAFRVGAAAWGVQYHPEVTRTDFEDWIRLGHPALLVESLDAEPILVGYHAAEPDLAALATAHAGAFAAVVAAVVASG